MGEKKEKFEIPEVWRDGLSVLEFPKEG